MGEILHLSILILYTCAQYLLGRTLVGFLFGEIPQLLKWMGSFLTGVSISIPFTYALSLMFAKTAQPMLWSALSFIGVTVFLYRSFGTKSKDSLISSFNFSTILFVLFSFVFSFWLMTKTFHGGEGGVLYVGSNNVFDFGHALGIIRSFSWGANIPFMSPFQAGLPFFYHFFFFYWVGLWEYFGVPIVWAMNIPSIVSFMGLLIVVYYLPQLLFKQNKWVGWIAVLLTMTNSTLTWWHLLIQKGFGPDLLRSIWQLPTYPFAGPFDGSVISIFTTLNNYVNQRHLAFATAVGLFFIIGLMAVAGQNKIHKGKIFIFGLLVGILFLWNMAICAGVVGIATVFFLFEKKWKEFGLFLAAVLFGVCVEGFTYISRWKDVVGLLEALNTAGNIPSGTRSWNGIYYIWENLSLLPLLVVLGGLTLQTKKRSILMTFGLLFVVVCLLAVWSGRGFDQKFFSLFIIGANSIAAIGLVWIWKKFGLIGKVMGVGIFFVLTVSGFIDLMPIKNEFAFPIVNEQLSPVVSWIHSRTPKNSVFVSYADMIDPVALAGRKNYFGFFGNMNSESRSKAVSAVYNGDMEVAEKSDISYILLSKGLKNDFPYTIDMEALQEKTSRVFESDRYLIFQTDGMLK